MPNNIYEEIEAGAGSMTRMSFALGATVCNLTSAIGAGNDHDWIGIQLEAGHLYRFNAGGFDTTLTLRDALGRQLAYNDDFGNTLNSQITFTATSSGLYFLDVAGFANRFGNYSLSATDTPLATASDIVGNTETGVALAVGGRNSSSTIGVAADHDWFRIDLQAGRQYCFNAVGEHGFDTTLSLRDAEGSLLSFNDDFGGTLNSQITYTATSTASYYLDVAGYANLVGNYSLSAIDTTSPPVVTDTTPATASDIVGNAETDATLAVGGRNSSTIGVAADHDWFRIDLQAGRQYCFNAVGEHGFDTTLSLRDAEGSLLSFNDDFGGTLNSQITHTATSTASYYLDVTGYSSRIGAYNLSSALIDGSIPAVMV